MRTFKIMVTGSRHHTDDDLIWATLDDIVDGFAGNKNVVLIEGGAPGADKIAHYWAIARGYDVHTFPADWTRFGRAAGPLRNQQMVDQHPDYVAAFPLDDSRGTWDAVRRAKSAGIPTRIDQ